MRTIPRRLLTLLGLLALLAAPLAPAWAKTYQTSYGSYRSRVRDLPGGRTIKVLTHRDAQGRRIASSCIVRGPQGTMQRERVKLNLPGGIGAGSASVLAEIYAAHYVRTFRGGRVPTATAAVVDLDHGTYQIGTSGKPRPQLIHDLLRKRMPSTSREPWSVDNCAEFKAVNTALQQGMELRNMEVHTVRTKSGQAFPRCHNCQLTTAGTRVTSDGVRMDLHQQHHRSLKYSPITGTSTLPGQQPSR